MTELTRPLRTGRAALVLRGVGLSLDNDDPLVILLASFLFPKPNWLSALRAGVPEVEALWAVQWLVIHNVPEENSYWMVGNCMNEYTPMDRAAKRGFFSVVQYLHDHSDVGCTDYAMEHAAIYGHLDVVRFLHEHRAQGNVNTAIWCAAKHGHLQIIRNLHEGAQTPVTMSEWAISARYGYLDVLQYVHAHLPPTAIAEHERPLVDIMSEAIQYGYMDVVAWLHEHVPGARGCSESAFLDAILFDRYEAVEFVLDQRYALDCVKAMDYAASVADDVRMMELFHAKSPSGCTTDALDNAAKGGEFAIVRFLSEQRTGGCTTAAMDEAGTCGWFDIVQYLHEHRHEGCTTAAMDGAAREGHLQIVQYLDQHRTEGCTTAAIDDAAENGHLAVVEYLTQHRTEGCTTKAMDQAAANGHIEVLRYLHDHWSVGCTAAALDQAAANGHLNVVKFLYELGFQTYTQPTLANAAINGHLGVVQFLNESCPGNFLLEKSVVAACIRNKRLGLLRYLHTAGLVQFDEDDLVLAIQWNQLDTIDFIYGVAKMPDQRTEWMRVAIEAAAACRFKNVLELLDAKRPQDEVFTSSAIEIASNRGYLDIAEYLLMHGHEGSTKIMMDRAAARGRLDLVQYLHENRADGCTYKAVEYAVRWGHVEVVQFLLDHGYDGCMRLAAQYEERGIDGRSQRPAINYAEILAALPCPCRYCGHGGVDPVTGTPPPWDFDDY